MSNGSSLLPFVIPSEAEGSAVRPSDLPNLPSKPQPPNRSVIPTEAQRSGGTCCSVVPNNECGNGNTPLPLSSRAEPRDLQCAPRTSQIFLPNPNPQTEVSSQPKRSYLQFNRPILEMFSTPSNQI